MKLNKKEQCVEIQLNESELAGFYDYLLENDELYKETNIILNISSLKGQLIEENFVFLEQVSTSKNDFGTSFVIVNIEANPNDYSDTVMIVPTVEEALDVIDFDIITRELL